MVTNPTIYQAHSCITSVMIGRNIRQICQILLISWIFGKTQMFTHPSFCQIISSQKWKVLQITFFFQQMSVDNMLMNLENTSS